jgi:hypothetical protein
VRHTLTSHIDNQAPPLAATSLRLVDQIFMCALQID